MLGTMYTILNIWLLINSKAVIDEKTMEARILQHIRLTSRTALHYYSPVRLRFITIVCVSNQYTILLSVS